MQKVTDAVLRRRVPMLMAASALVAVIAVGGPTAAADRVATAAKAIAGKQIKKKSLPYNRLDKKAKNTVTNLGLASNVRSAYSSAANLNLAGTGGNQTVRTVQITVPTAGQLLINGGLRPDGATADIYSCDLLLNGALMGASSRGQEKSAAADQSCETSDAADVPAGTHSVELRAIGVVGTNEIDDTSLQLLFVPTP